MKSQRMIELFAVTALCGGAFIRADDGPRPNILLIVTDDQDFSTIGAFGGNVLTPNIDRLAETGIRLERMYVTSAICTPSRYTILTGRYPSQCTHEHFLHDHPTPDMQAYPDFSVHLEPDRLNLPRVLQENGYVTGLVGKWHLGGEIPEMGLWKEMGLHNMWSDVDVFDPEISRKMGENYVKCAEHVKGLGFDSVEALYWSNWYGVNDEGVTVILNNQEWISGKAVEFLETNKNRPFFLSMNTTLDHKPNQNEALTLDMRITPAGLLEEEPRSGMPSRDTIQPRLKAVGVPPVTARLTHLDDGVGVVLNKLDELGLTENTLVIYMADNGINVKATCYEGGVHVPGIVRWPAGLPQGGKNSHLISNIDLTTTILSACGIPVPEELDARGENFLPLLRGEQTAWRDAAFLEIGNTRAVVTERWKYIAFRVREPWLLPPRDKWPKGHGGVPGLMRIHGMAHQPAYWDPDQLYDLKNDPKEQANLAGNPEYAPVLAEMKSRLAAFCKTFERPFAEFTESK